MIFVQIVSDAAAEVAGTTAKQSISFWGLTVAGGWVMIPLIILWILAIYLFVERMLTINKADEDPDQFMSKVKDLVIKGDINGAKTLCNQNHTPIARMIEKGISRIGRPLKNIESSIENVGKIEVFKLEKNLSFMATIAGAAPMLGFLGTVLGMVKAFIAVSQQAGSMSPKLLSSGIYTALITTVTGMIVGIMAYLAYNFLVARVQKVVNKMEYTAIDFIDLLQEPR